jgi:transposase InsO family protein
MSRYRFIEAESRRYSVTQLCRIAQVSRTAYYEWQDGEPSQRERDDAALTAKIRAIHAASDGQYGVPRVLAELRVQGQDVGRKRVARLMKAAGLRGRRPPRWVRTTTPEPTPPAIPDLVHGQFEALSPNVLWVGDITYIRTWEGWLYLATVLDVFSRRVIGFALAGHMRASLVCDALTMAVATRGGNVDGVIFHSDRGSQYTSAEFRALCDAHGVKQSVSTTSMTSTWGRPACAGTTPSPSRSSRPTSSSSSSPGHGRPGLAHGRQRSTGSKPSTTASAGTQPST